MNWCGECIRGFENKLQYCNCGRKLIEVSVNDMWDYVLIHSICPEITLERFTDENLS